MDKKNQLGAVAQRWGYIINDEALSGYIEASGIDNKNENIQKLFKDSKDGRIVIDIKKYLTEDASDLGIMPEEDLQNLFNNIGSEVEEIGGLPSWSANKLYRDLRNAVLSPMFDFSTKRAINYKGLLTNFPGQKICKTLNGVLDASIMANYDDFQDFRHERLSKTVDFLRRKIINGRIAGLLTDSSYKSLEGLSLVLSINPIDFYTMSVGTTWASCMAPGGEFDSGALPYSTGRDSLISYLAYTDQVEEMMKEDSLNFFVEKIWRSIIYITPTNFILGQRPYPSNRKVIELGIAHYINNKLNFGYSINESNSLSEQDFYTKNTGLNTGYIDFVQSSGNLCTIFGNKDQLSNDTRDWSEEGDKVLEINPQSQAFCFNCGRKTKFLTDSEGVCDDCDCHCICERCGDRVEEDQGDNTEDGFVCDWCIEEEYSYSEYQMELINNDNALPLLTVLGSGRRLGEDYISANYPVSLISLSDLGNKEEVLHNVRFYQFDRSMEDEIVVLEDDTEFNEELGKDVLCI